MRRNNAWLMLLIAMTCLPFTGRAQDTFRLDGNESLALRIHDWYRQSQDRLAQLEADRIKVKGFISEVAPASTMVGTAIAPEDVAKLAQINEDIALEQERCRLLEAAWEKNRAVPPAPARSFVWRYGPLSESAQRSINPKYDKIEYAIRTFRFNEPARSPASAATVTKRGSSPFDGLWHTHRVHTDGCSYIADDDLTLSTDADGITSIAGAVFTGGRGRVTGSTYSFSYGPGNTGAVTLAKDGRSFSGSFADSNNHRGTLQGKR